MRARARNFTTRNHLPSHFFGVISRHVFSKMVVLVLVLHFFPHLFSRSELPVELREEEKEQAQKILLGSTRMEQTWWVFSRYCLYFFAVLCCTEKIRELSILSFPQRPGNWRVVFWCKRKSNPLPSWLSQATSTHAPKLNGKWLSNNPLFPTCQVRVVRFYVSLPACPSSFLLLLPPSSSFLLLFSSFHLLPPPDLNCKL